MRSKVSSSVVLALGLLFSVAERAVAHDYWFDVQDGAYLLYRGHRFSQHTGEGIEPYEPSIIRSASCLTADGDNEALEAEHRYPLRIPGNCDAINVVINSGYWSDTPEGLKNQPKSELPETVDSWQALENVKAVNAWSERLLEPLSSGLELVLTSDPFELERGEKLRIVSVLDGQPAQGVTVAYDGDPRGVTDRNGQINIRIRHGGLQNISASIVERLDSELADNRLRSAVLQFELP